MKYLVDVPDINGEWDEVASFDTREEAVKFIQTQFGGDSEGRIGLITEVGFEDDEE